MEELEELMNDQYAFCFSFYKEDQVAFSQAEQRKGLELLNIQKKFKNVEVSAFATEDVEMTEEDKDLYEEEEPKQQADQNQEQVIYEDRLKVERRLTHL